MASKKADKGAKEKSKGGGLMAMLSKVFAILAILSAAILFAGALDVGHLGLAGMMGSLAVVPLVLFTLCTLALVFVGGGNKAAPGMQDNSELGETLADFQAKTASRFATMQNTLDAMTGQNHEALLEENKALKAELDAVHEAERSKVDGEVERLRQKNEELEQRIRDWAVQTVGAAVAAEKAEEMKAA